MGQRMLEVPVGGMVSRLPWLQEEDGPPPGVSYRDDVQLPVPQHCNYCGTHPKWDGDNRCSNCGAPRSASARIKEIDVMGLNRKQTDRLLTRAENGLALATQRTYD